MGYSTNIHLHVARFYHYLSQNSTKTTSRCRQELSACTTPSWTGTWPIRSSPGPRPSTSARAAGCSSSHWIITSRTVSSHSLSINMVSPSVSNRACRHLSTFLFKVRYSGRILVSLTAIKTIQNIFQRKNNF